MKTHSKTIEIVSGITQIGEIEKSADDYSANPCRNLPKSVNNKRCLRFIFTSPKLSGKSQGYCINGFCLKDGRISVITSQLQISKHHAGRSLIFGRAESAVASPDFDSFSGAFHDKLETTADSERTINDHLSI